MEEKDTRKVRNDNESGDYSNSYKKAVDIGSGDPALSILFPPNRVKLTCRKICK